MTVDSFYQTIEGAVHPIRSKKVSIIDCIPVANKKVSSAADVDKVLAAIKDWEIAYRHCAGRL